MGSRHPAIDSFSQYQSALASLNRTEQAPTSDSEEKADSSTGPPPTSEAPFGSALQPFPSTFPSVKRIPGTRFVVDGFRSAGPWSVSYFLSHFHSDHYTGLTNLWAKGLVFCSEITAHLVRDSLLVPDALVVALPAGTAASIDGCEVTLVDANHCPGAVQFLIRVPTDAGEWQRYVHCGDMRFSSAMKTEASLCDFVGADAVFLDTTYCNPKFVFPPQQTSVDYVAETIHRLMGQEGSVEGVGPNVDEEGEEDEGDEGDEDDENRKADSADEVSKSGPVLETGEEEPGERMSPRQDGAGATLFLISTYVIGKEKILTAVAKRCNCSIYVTEKKLTILKRLDIEDIGVFTTDPAATNVHVVKWSFLGETWPYFRPNFVNMEKTKTDGGYRRVVGFVPTGWTYELKKKTFSVRRKGPLEIHLVPYSEHSNYEELREYVAFLRPKEIIPTVGLEGGGMDGKAVAAMRKHFRNLVDETASKRRFLKGFSRKPPEESSDFVPPKALFGRAPRKRTWEAVESGETPAEVVSPLPEDQCRSGFPQNRPREQNEGDLAEDVKGTDMNVDKHLLEAQGKYVVSPERETGQENGRPNKSVSLLQSGSVHSSEGALQSAKASNQIAFGQSVQVSTSEKALGGKGDQGKRSQGKTPVKKLKPLAVKPAKNNGKTRAPSRTGPSSQALTSRKQKAMQPSILNFFKKNMSPTQINHAREDVIITECSTQQKDVNSGVCDATVLTQKTTQTPLRLKKWADEYEQLASIVDGDLSEEMANHLLNKAGGDVGVALDLYYIEKQVEHKGDNGNAPVESQSVIPAREQSPAALSIEISDGLDTEKLAPESDALNQVHTPEGSQSDANMWADKLEQLVSILDGSLSRDDTLKLLEKAKGNVAIALDCFYCKQNDSDVGMQPIAVSQPDECKSEPDGHGSGRPVTMVENISLSSAEESIPEAKAPSTVINSGGPKALVFSPGSRKLNESSGKNAAEGTGSVGTPVGKYVPSEHACWQKGEPAPYLHLARAFDLIEQESGRLKTADMLCNMFRSLLALSPEAVLPAIYLTTNRIAPEFENGELSIGGSLVSTAITEVAGVPRAKLRDMYTKMGDLGDVAQACRQTQSSLRLPPPLGICQVFSTLKHISKEAGTGSGARKKDLVLGLLRSCREKETKYIVRTLIQNMRIGAMMKTVLSALAQAVVLHHSFSADQAPEKALLKLKPRFQEASTAVVEAYNFLPNLDLMVPTLIKDGVEGLSTNLTISPGTPIKPMLAKITNGIPELLKRFQGQPFTCEYKYDGQRAQIHMLQDGTVRIFTRDSGNATGRFPDVIQIVRDAAKPDLQSFVIDAEIVAVDRENENKLMAFQHLSTRERGARDGSSISLQNIKVQVGVFAFDMMFANNESLVKRTLQERRKCMHHWFPNTKPGYFGYATETTVDADEDPVTISQKIQGNLEEAFAASCEGLMAKALVEDSVYMASKRSDSWLKIKRDYVEGLQDSLDLVPIGAWHGNGRKAGWYSPFLLACYDPETEEYQSVCRVMSGFTDVFYREMTEFYSGDHVLPRKPPYYRTGEEPNVWFTPELVWEIRGADFTVSPVHQAAVGLVHPSRGISMRFPRFIKSRPDKKPDIASPPTYVADLFHKQTRKAEMPTGS